MEVLIGLVLVPLLALPAPGPASRSGWPSTRHAAVTERADSLFQRGRAQGYAFLDSVITSARANRDLDLEMVASVRKSDAAVLVDYALEAGREGARRWLPRARAARDTLTWCRALRTVGIADIFQQHWLDARRYYGELLPLARRAHLTAMEGYAWIGVSYLAIQNGDAAAAEGGYRRALRLIPTTDGRALRTARAGLANALYSQIKPDAARREYGRVVLESRAAGDRGNEIDAINDLGALELQYGDPSVAARYFREAAEGNRALGRTLYSGLSQGNLGVTLAALGHADEASAIFDSLASLAFRDGDTERAARLLGDLARALRRQGRLVEAEDAARRAVASRDSVSVTVWASGLIELAEILRARGSAEEARRLVRDALAQPRERLGKGDRATLLQELGECDIAGGDLAAAVAPLREASALHRDVHGVLGAGRVHVEASLAAAFSGLGARDSALVHFRLAAAAWERSRAAPSDPEWREAIGGMAATVYGRYAALLLDPARGGTGAQRAAEAFAALQPFHARTLEDALHGAEGRSALPRIALNRLQRDVLRPGEVLVDIFAAPETTLVFAVTRDGVRFAGAPGVAKLRPRLLRFRDLLAARNADPELIAGSAAALGSDLLDGLAAPIHASRSVLVVAAGFADLPLAMLRLPGESEPLAILHEVAMVPSATLLSSGRAMSTSVVRNGGVLALSRSTDAEGRRLTGVERETQWMRREIPGALVRENDGRLTLDEMLRGLGQREVLHLAAHARVPAQAPWRAGFLLGHGTGEDAYLTASRISTLPLPARLCVLASCTSAGVAGAEGMPNLAAAWLSSGATAVVATLWPQDDQDTADFVSRFYSQLGLGQPVGPALREAQRAMRAGRGSGPGAWAGFVLIGDPATRVTLAAPGAGPPASARPRFPGPR